MSRLPIAKHAIGRRRTCRQDRLKAIAFDAYGTLFDVHSVGALAEELFPGQGAALAEIWRVAQIDYTRMRTLCDRYADFRQVTEDALVFAAEKLGLDLDAGKRVGPDGAI